MSDWDQSHEHEGECDGGGKECGGEVSGCNEDDDDPGGQSDFEEYAFEEFPEGLCVGVDELVVHSG